MTTYNFGNFDFDRYLDGYGLSPERIAVSINIALQYTARIAENIAANNLSGKLGLSREVIDKRVFSGRSRLRQNGAYVVGYRKPMNLVRFGAQQTASGLSSSRGNFPGAFLAKMPNGRMQIAVQRVGRARLPIKPVTYNVRPEFEKVFRELLDSKTVKTVLLDEINKQLAVVKIRQGA